MSRYEKDQTVIYKNQECKVTGVYFGDKYILETPDGKSVITREEDLKDPTKIKRLDDVIKEKEVKKNDSSKSQPDSSASSAEKTTASKQESIKNQERDKKKEAKPVSFAVVTRDYVNGYSNGYEARETIVSGKSKDGVTFESSVYGKDFSKKELEKIATHIVLNADLTTSKQDKEFAMDRIQELLNTSEDYIVYTGDGRYITGTEINDNLTIKYEDNLEKFGDPHPENNEEVTISNPEAVEAAKMTEDYEETTENPMDTWDKFTTPDYDELEEDDYEERSLF